MTDRKARQIIEVDLDDLIPYIRNARTHSAEQIQQIAASIREFGFNSPVLVDAENGIVAGHGRVLAAQLLGLNTVPCVRLDWLTEAQKRAYILADNKIAENSAWDQAMLDAELADLADLDIDMTGLGFELGEHGDDPAVEEKPAVETGPVRDVFWINIVGPLKNQADVLDRLRAAMADIEPVTIELGTVNRD
jgi:ParB-like chromosome segregation protein Spo0J